MTPKIGFIGFPDKKMKAVVIPDLFFADLLPQINDLAELKLTLHCFWLLNEQEGELRYLRGVDLRDDLSLRQSLMVADDLRPPQEVVADALARAVARNTLLKLEIVTETESGDYRILNNLHIGDDVAFDDAAFDDAAFGDEADGHSDIKKEAELEEASAEDWYFMNTVKGRKMLAMIRQGRLSELQAVIPDNARLHVDRPNVFTLYEQNIGMMTPLVADQLRDMEKSYSPEWVQDAFELAVAKNARNLRYIQAILKRWSTDGRNVGRERDGGRGYAEHGRDSEQSESRYQIPDEYADIIIG